MLVVCRETPKIDTDMRLARHDDHLPIHVFKAFLEFNADAKLTGFQFHLPTDVPQALDRSLHAITDDNDFDFGRYFKRLRKDQTRAAIGHVENTGSEVGSEAERTFAALQLQVATCGSPSRSAKILLSWWFNCGDIGLRPSVDQRGWNCNWRQQFSNPSL